MDAFFRFFERFAQPFERPYAGRPPAGGLAFIHHFARQTPRTFLAMLVLGGLTALIEASLFMFVGIIVDMMNGSAPDRFFELNLSTLLWMALLVAVLRTVVAVATAVLEEQIVVPEFFTLVRWQSHKAVSRQDVSFFDDEMAGRVSSKVWQGGQGAGDFLVSLLQIIWFIVVFAVTSLVVIASLDWRVMIFVLAWLIMIALVARVSVPNIRDRSRATAEAVAVLTGRMVDGYSNIRTLKLHSASDANDAFVQAAWKDVLAILRHYTRAIATMRIAFQTLSSCMLVVIAAVALWLYSGGGLSAGEVAVILTLCLRLNLLMGRLLGLLNGLFRNFGTVQNTAQLIAKQPKINDIDQPVQLPPAVGNVQFDKIRFGYGTGRQIIEGLNLHIPSGQKVGLVGESGVGKTTLINLLLRFYDLEAGRIMLDGVDISQAAQDDLRRQFGIVSQDTSLLHRSIRDNIALGNPTASQAQIEQAAKRAKAHDFIVDLEDIKGRTGYDTHVGERGVKLSGGQRQRIALARVFLKDAPILLLDEATSSLDSEVEAAIQEHLEELMKGKTVIAIAHRLSTIAHMDRLIVMEAGRIVEDGNHDTLLKAKGLYARLWERQSGGFLTSNQRTEHETA